MICSHTCVKCGGGRFPGDRASRSVADHMEIIEALEAREAELASGLSVNLHALAVCIQERWTRQKPVHPETVTNKRRLRSSNCKQIWPRLKPQKMPVS